MITFLFFIFTASTAVTEGAGLLPDGPLEKQVGDSVLFSTSKTPTEKPFVSVFWTVNNTDIIIAANGATNTAPQYEGRITYFPSTASLELRNLLTNDSGLYEVETVSDALVRESGSIIMNVYEAVSGVTVIPDSADLVENASVSLRCFSLGSSLTFLWMNGSTEVTASDRVLLTDGNRNLTFTSVSRYDHGLYTCLVSNPVSHNNATVTITVNYGPEDTHVVVSPDKQYHEIGSTIILKCFTNSRPTPEFTWLMNSTPMLQDGEELKLMDVTTLQNGNYSCRAFNPNTSMTVESPPVSISVIELISDVSLNSTPVLPVEGMSANLTCEASGSIFTRKWKKGNSDLIMTDNMTLYDNDKVLSFNVVTKQDTGEYKCNVSNPLSSKEVEYLFIVNYGPENVEITGESDVKEGSPIKLSCVAKSVPDAHYSWALNGDFIHNNSKEFQINHARPSDGGNYTCNAWNEITDKTSSAGIQLFVTDKPPPPPPPYWIIPVVLVAVGCACAAGVALYYCLKKKNLLTKKSSDIPVSRNSPTDTGGGAQDNATYSEEEVNYANIKSFQKRNGERVQLGSQDTTSEYSEVKGNNNHASTSSPPTYDVHMQRINRPTPQPRINAAPIYSEVKRNRDQ